MTILRSQPPLRLVLDSQNGCFRLTFPLARLRRRRRRQSQSFRPSYFPQGTHTYIRARRPLSRTRNNVSPVGPIPMYVAAVYLYLGRYAHVCPVTTSSRLSVCHATTVSQTRDERII